MKLKITYSLLALTSIAMASIGLRGADLVGTLPGEFSVDNRGSANYSIPLAIPPGIEGVQPSLSVNYNSSGDNGIMGIGFSLSAGQSSIKRGRSLLAREGVVRGIEFSDDDQLYLDGRLLVNISGTDYLKSGSEYRTEVESFRKIVAVGTTGADATYFKVTTKDGTAYYYGNYNGSTNASQMLGGESAGKVYTWALSRIEDLSGRYIEYNYSEVSTGSGEYTLDSIEYTGILSPATDTFAKIEFLYNQNTVTGDTDTLRDDYRSGYLAQREFVSTQRLDKIVVTCDDENGSPVTVARYTFIYEYSDDNRITRLKSIQTELKPSNSTTLDTIDDTSFDWTAYQEDRIDPIFRDETGFGDSFGQNLPSVVMPDGTPSVDGFGDFNGDGKTDYIHIVSGATGQNPGFDVYLSDGTKFAEATSWLSPGGPTNSSQYFFFFTADFNGDGKDDVLWANDEFDDFRMALANQSGTGFSYVDSGNAVISDGNLFRDWDAVAEVYDSSEHTREFAGVGIASRLSVADFTGDGRADLLFHRFGGDLVVAKSTGSGFSTSTPSSGTAWSTSAKSVTPKTYMLGTKTWTEIYEYFNVKPVLGDYNGDGLMDYAYVAHVNVENASSSPKYSEHYYYTQVSINNGGESFFTDRGVDSSSATTNDTASLYINALYKVLPGDFNGDSITDLLILRAGSGVQYWKLLTFNGSTDGTLPKYDHLNVLPLTFSILNETVPSFYRPCTQAWWNANVEGLSWMDYQPVNTPTLLEDGVYRSIAGLEIQNMAAADLNHDGMTDYLWIVDDDDANINGWWVCYSKGVNSQNVFEFEVPVKLSGSLPSAEVMPAGANDTDLLDYWATILNISQADLNGDNLPDWMITRNKWNSEGHYAFSLSKGTTGNLLESIENGLGVKTEIDYSCIKDDSVYTLGATVAYPIMETRHAPMVVSDVYKDVGGTEEKSFSVTRDDDGAVTTFYGAHRFSYQYSGNRTDLSGRGNLGFHSFVTFDHESDLIKYQFVTQSFPMTGLTKREQTYRAANFGFDANGDLTVDLEVITSQDNDVVFDEVKASPGGPLTGSVFPFMSHSMELRWEFAKANALELQSGDPESLFTEYNSEFTTNKGLAHSDIETFVWFDEQSTSTDPNGNLPTGYLNSSAPGGQDGVPVGFEQWLNHSTGGYVGGALDGFDLPGEISYGNIVRTRIDYSDGYYTDTYTDYHVPASTNSYLTGLVEWTQVVADTPHSTQPQGSPVTNFTYYDTGKVHEKTINAQSNASPAQTTVANGQSDARLNLKTTYTYTSADLVDTVTIQDSTTEADYDLGSSYLVSDFDYDYSNRFIQKKTNTYGHWTEFEYDDFGRVTYQEDINGEETETDYDGLGRVTQVRDILRGQSVTTTIGEASGTGVTGIQTVSLGSTHTNSTINTELTDILLPGSKYYVRTVATERPPVTVHFDRLGREIRQITEGYSNKKTYKDTVYDLEGQLVAQSTPYSSSGSPSWIYYAYDDLGRKVLEDNPVGNLISTTYLGRVTQVEVDAYSQNGVDPAGQKTTTLVNVKGETTMIWNADKSTGTLNEKGTGMSDPSLEFVLDGFGRVMQTQAWQGGSTYLTTIMEYDALGNQHVLDDPDKGVWTYTYDALGRLRRLIDENGSQVVFTYDQLDRLLQRTSTGAGSSSGYSEIADWYYYDSATVSGRHAIADANNGWIGAVQRESLSVTDSTWSTGSHATVTAYYYDSHGNPYLNLHNIDNKWYYRTTAYDNRDRPVRVDYFWRPPGYESDYSTLPYAWQSYGIINEYDSESYITSVSDTQGKYWWEAHSSAGYDYLDRPVLFQKGESYWTSQAYHQGSELPMQTRTGTLAGTTVTGIAQENEYLYDGLGNLFSREDVLHSAEEQFTYDSLNRLTSADIVSETRTLNYGYDYNGNITSKDDVNDVSSAYSYDDDNHPHAVSGAFGYSMQYDENGNVVSRSKTGETWAFKWAAFDKPRWMGRETTTNTRGSAFLYGINRQRVVHYKFDSFDKTASPWEPDNLTDKKIYVTPGMEVDYTDDGSGWEMETVRIYIPAPGQNAGVVELNPDPTSSADHDYQVYHYDHLGSIQAVTAWGESGITRPGLFWLDDQGDYLLYSYDPFGERRAPETWIGSADSQITYTWGIEDPLTRGYTGHEMLDDLGLVHMNGRIYDPLLGRFLSADLFIDGPTNLQGYNRYSYVKNSPLNHFDPSGYGAVEPSWMKPQRLDALTKTYGPELALEISNDLDRKEAMGGIGAAIILAIIAQPEVAAILDGLLNIASSEDTPAEQPLEDFKPIPVDGDTVDPQEQPAKDGPDKRILYRSVSKEEAQDIEDTSRFRPHPDGKSMESKWFSETEEGAKEQGLLNHGKDVPIVEAEAGRELVDNSYKHENIDGTGPGVVIEEEDLPKVQPIKITYPEEQK